MWCLAVAIKHGAIHAHEPEVHPLLSAACQSWQNPLSSSEILPEPMHLSHTKAPLFQMCSLLVDT